MDEAVLAFARSSGYFGNFMLTIRRNQMQAFRRYMLASFIGKLIPVLRQQCPELCRALGERGVRAVVYRGIRRGKSFGFASEHELAGFVLLQFHLGPDFDADPRYHWARAVLTDPSLSPEAKLGALGALTDEELARRAERNRRWAAWTV